MASEATSKEQKYMQVSGVVEVFRRLSELSPPYEKVGDITVHLEGTKVVSFVTLVGLAAEFLTDRARAVFDICDVDKDGRLNRKELSEALELLRVDPHADSIAALFQSVGFKPDTQDAERELFYHIFPAMVVSPVVSDRLKPTDPSEDEAEAGTSSETVTTEPIDKSPEAMLHDSGTEAQESGSAPPKDMDHAQESSAHLQEEAPLSQSNPNDLTVLYSKLQAQMETLKLQLSCSEANEQRLKDLLKLKRTEETDDHQTRGPATTVGSPLPSEQGTPGGNTEDLSYWQTRCKKFEEDHKRLQDIAEENEILLRDEKTKTQQLQLKLEQQQAVNVTRISTLQLALENEQAKYKDLQGKSTKTLADLKTKEAQFDLQTKQMKGRVSLLEQNIVQLHNANEATMRKLHASQEMYAKLEAECASRGKQSSETENPLFPSTPTGNPPSPSHSTSPVLAPLFPPQTPPKLKSAVQQLMMLQQDSTKPPPTPQRQALLEAAVKQATEAKNAIEAEFIGLSHLHKQTEDNLASALRSQQILQERCDQVTSELSEGSKRFEAERVELLQEASKAKSELKATQTELEQTKQICQELKKELSNQQELLESTKAVHTQQIADIITEVQSRQSSEHQAALIAATENIHKLEQEVLQAHEKVVQFEQKLTETSSGINQPAMPDYVNKLEGMLAQAKSEIEDLGKKNEYITTRLAAALDDVREFQRLLDEEKRLHECTSRQLVQAQTDISNLRMDLESRHITVQLPSLPSFTAMGKPLLHPVHKTVPTSDTIDSVNKQLSLLPSFCSPKGGTGISNTALCGSCCCAVMCLWLMTRRRKDH
ncbi:hypothetical protein Pelo_13606 [Pelomyxa schiedti]|nr:hypothetical protein Pelo_13606 [Pelomyxa schiedti]